MVKWVEKLNQNGTRSLRKVFLHEWSFDLALESYSQNLQEPLIPCSCHFMDDRRRVGSLWVGKKNRMDPT